MPSPLSFLPRTGTGFDPFGSLARGFATGLELRDAWERASALRQAREALRQYAATGQPSALRAYDPRLEWDILSRQAQAETNRLMAAREYLATALPFMTREQIPALYRTLEEQFGIPTRGWKLPATDEEFEVKRRQLMMALGIKPPEEHVVLERTPQGVKEVFRGTAKPIVKDLPKQEVLVDPRTWRTLTLPPGRTAKVVKDHKATVKLFEDPLTGRTQFFSIDEVPEGWIPAESKGTLMSMAFEAIKSNPALGEKFAKAPPSERAKILKETMESIHRARELYAKGTTPEEPERKKSIRELWEEVNKAFKRYNELLGGR